MAKVSKKSPKKVPAAPALPAAPPAPRNVLAFHSGALGDFILTWPILLGAARVMAQSRVIAVVPGGRGKLAEQVLRLEHRDVETGGWHKLFGGNQPDERPRKLLANSRLLIGILGKDQAKWAQAAAVAAPAAEVLLLDPPPRDLAGQHATAFLLGGLAANPILQSAASGMVDSINKSGLLPRYHDPAGPVLLHPGSGSAKKNWPVDGWLDLANRLRDAGRRVRVILGEVEQERVNADAAAAFEAVADVQRPGDLPELLFLLRGAGGYVGHDTGPTHLAATIGLPTVALFGPATDPAVWQPLGPRVTVHQTEDLADLDPATVPLPS